MARIGGVSTTTTARFFRNRIRPAVSPARSDAAERSGSKPSWLVLSALARTHPAIEVANPLTRTSSVWESQVVATTTGMPMARLTRIWRTHPMRVVNVQRISSATSRTRPRRGSSSWPGAGPVTDVGGAR